MRIPLIVNASPSFFTESSKVRLRSGIWKLEHDLVDTEIESHVEYCKKLDDGTIDVDPWGIGQLWISIKKRGTEPRINIFVVQT